MATYKPHKAHVKNPNTAVKAVRMAGNSTPTQSSMASAMIPKGSVKSMKHGKIC